MNKTLIAAVVTLLVAPQIALASWWNPFSWFKKSEIQQPQKFNVIVNTDNKAEVTPSVTNEESSLQQADKNVASVSSYSPTTIFYPVVKVVDGDTLSINMHGTITTLRLIGVNTPETVDPRRPVECFGKEASQKAKEVLMGKKVLIMTDPSQGTFDKYSRTLAYVFLEDGTNFNEYMIKEGYAYEYTYNTPYQYQREFKLAQSEAQVLKKGLWAEGVCGMKNISTMAPITPAQAPNIPTEETSETTSHPTPIPQTFVTQIQPTTNNMNYICSRNTYNCTDFSTHAGAQTAYDACGGVSNDIHQLDKDKDGQACETLP